jgi:hypothetical protein
MRLSFLSLFLLPCSLLAAAAPDPEKPLNALFKQMAEKAVEVDGVIVAAKTLKVRGVIHGVNSDLTMTTQEGVPGRTVILDGKSWTSGDDKNWEAAAEIDRSFAKLMMGPVIYTDRASPPFEEVDRTEKNGRTIQHIRLKVPKGEEHAEMPHYWIAWSKGKPVEIVRAEVPLLTGGRTITVKADYRITGELPAIKAPVALTKQPQTTPQLAPEVLLAAAKKNMANHAAWKFSAEIEDDEDNTKMNLTGVLEGANCDLVRTGTGGDKFHQKIIGDFQYSSTDGGKTWQKGAPERDLYFLVNTPTKPRKGENIPPFEVVQATAGGEGVAIMHVRFKAPDAISGEGDRPNYWIAITDGKPSAVIRYHGPMGYHNHYVTGRVEYEPAELKEDGKPLVTPPVSRQKR